MKNQTTRGPMDSVQIADELARVDALRAQYVEATGGDAPSNGAIFAALQVQRGLCQALTNGPIEAQAEHSQRAFRATVIACARLIDNSFEAVRMAETLAQSAG